MSVFGNRAGARQGAPQRWVAAPLLALALGALPSFGAAQSSLSPDKAPDTAEPPRTRLSGFATLGGTYHSNGTAGVINSFAQRSPADKGLSANLDSVAGAQIDHRLLEGTSFTAQGVVRIGDDYSPKLRMAYLRQQIGNDAAVRVGRIRSPLYFDSDVAEIGFAYLPVRPAIPIYGVVANYVPHLDGIDLQWRRSIGNAGVMLQAYGGRSEGTQRFYNTSPEDEAKFDLSGIRGLALSVGLPNITMRASRTWVSSFKMRSSTISGLNDGLAQVAGGLSQVASNPFLPPQLAAALGAQAQGIAGLADPFNSRPVYTSIGMDANLGDWRVLAEWVNFDSQNDLVGRYNGGQVTVGYNWGAFTPYAGASRNKRKSGSLNTSSLSPTGVSPALDAGIAAAKAGLEGAAQFADLSSSSVTLGVRWDVRDDLAVKFQYDRITTPSSTTPGPLAVPRMPFDNRVNLFSVTLNFVF